MFFSSFLGLEFGLINSISPIFENKGFNSEEEIFDYTRSLPGSKIPLIINTVENISEESCLKEILSCQDIANSQTILWVDNYNQPTIRKVIELCRDLGVIEVLGVHQSTNLNNPYDWVKAKFLSTNDQKSINKAIEKPIVNLGNFEHRIYSQNGEDGVLLELFRLIKPGKKYFVEFGVEDGKECNTRLLRTEHQWVGLMMDGSHSNQDINLQKEFITADNINLLFERHHVPHDLDLLSIDLDFNDFYVWNAISSVYQPKVVVIEYNATHLPNEDKIVKYDPNGMWDGSNFFGASILALARLGDRKGYTLVYANANGVNLFFVRNDIIAQLPIKFKDASNVAKIYRYPTYGKGPNGGHFADLNKRSFIRSIDVLK